MAELVHLLVSHLLVEVVVVWEVLARPRHQVQMRERPEELGRRILSVQRRLHSPVVVEVEVYLVAEQLLMAVDKVVCLAVLMELMVQHTRAVAEAVGVVVVLLQLVAMVGRVSLSFRIPSLLLRLASIWVLLVGSN